MYLNIYIYDVVFKQKKLGDGFRYFQFDEYFSDGLKAPTSITYILSIFMVFM